MPIKKPSSVVTIVLTWNSADFIEECLSSLIKSSYPTNILVVDNNSSDNTREVISKKFPKIKLVNSGSNIGYAGGNNFGIKIAQKENPEYIFLLNPDATVQKDCLKNLISRMNSEKDVGLASPIILYNDSKVIWYAGSSINWHNGVTSHIGANEIDEGQYSNNLHTERANGCAMIIRASKLREVGLMDEHYFLYYEETDWSVRFSNAGYSIGLVPAAITWHKASSSTGGHKSALYHYYMTRNRLYFMSKFTESRSKYFFARSIIGSWFSLVAILRKFGVTVFKNCLRGVAAGYYDYSKSKFGRRKTI
jgi:GT2 family glycosyltransferase